MIRFLNTIVLLFVFVIGSACSISKSSQSISNSISSPFKWSSNSSTSSSPSDDDGEESEQPAAEEARYEDDVSEYSFAFARDHQDPQTDEIASFRAGLARLAEKHGLTDWENDPLTIASIGRGFARADIDETRLRSFSTLLFGADLDKLEQLEKGMASASSTPPVAAEGQ